MPIAKVVVGNNACRCLNYVLTKDKAELLDTNCAGDTPAVMANEFEVAFQPHYRNGADRHTEDYVAHFSISFHTELPQPQLEAIAQRFQVLMGFDPVMNQYVLAQHHDTDDCHLHLVANRIRLDGTVVSDRFQQRRTEVAMRVLEVEFDLPRLQNSWEVDVRAPKVAEVRQSRESGKPIPRRVMQETIERCVAGAATLAELQSKLQESHVTLTATARDDGSWALLYQLAIEGEKVRTFSATKLGKRYTKRGLQSTFGISFGDAGVTAATVETVETVPPVVPLVVLPEGEPAIDPVVLAPNANADPEGFWVEPGSMSEPLPSFRPERVEAKPEREGFWQEPGNGPASVEGFRQSRQAAVAKQAASLRVEPLESTVETDGLGQSPLEAVAPATAGEGFGPEPLEPPVESDSLTTETAATPAPPLTPTAALAGFRPELNGSNAELEGFRVEPGKVSEPLAGFRHEYLEGVATPETQAERFRQQLELIAARLATTPSHEWTNDLTPDQTEARDENLRAVLQWTQSHIETLELRAIGIGLQNASDQERWDTLAAQAQQRGLTDMQQIEVAVTALACQQGYKTRAVVRLLQQSPRVKQALHSHALAQVQQTLTRSVVQVRESLAQRQQEAALHSKTNRTGR